MMNCRDYPSLLTREESGAIKGLLILLIVLGHNSLLMEPTGLFPYLYAFHVYCFYILPFIYGFRAAEPETPAFRVILRRSLHNFLRLYPLYFIWCMVGVLFSCFVKHQSPDALPIIYAVISGNQTLLARHCGFAFLWFLPTIVAVMFWRDLYFCLPRRGKCILLVISLSLWLLAVMGITNFHHSGLFTPFALAQGLYFSASGIIARWILEHCRVSVKSRIRAVPLFLLVPAFIRFRGYLPFNYTWLSWLIPPTIAFVCIFQYKGVLEKSRFLKLAGQYSLQIYLLHVLIFNLFLKIDPWKNWITGAAIYVLTVALCFGTAMLMKRSPFKRLLFT